MNALQLKKTHAIKGNTRKLRKHLHQFGSSKDFKGFSSIYKCVKHEQKFLYITILTEHTELPFMLRASS